MAVAVLLLELLLLERLILPDVASVAVSFTAVVLAEVDTVVKSDRQLKSSAEYDMELLLVDVAVVDTCVV